MTDRKNLNEIIDGLRCAAGDPMPCAKCRYREYVYSICKRKCAEDAIALLKAQEPMMVEERADTNTINCPKCGQQFAKVGRDKSIYLDTDEEPNYCPKCGQAVKWND